MNRQDSAVGDVDPGDDPAWLEHRRRRDEVEEATRCPHGLALDLCGQMCGPEPPPDPSGGIDDVAWEALRCLVAGIRPDRITDLQLLDVLEGAEHWVRRASALRMRSVAEIAERHPAGSAAPAPGADSRAVQPVSRWLPDQVAIVLRVPRDHARSLIGQAQRFARVLPETLAEWESGRIDQGTAEAIASSTLVLDDERARRVQAAVLPGAPGAHRRLLRDRLRRHIARIDPDGARERHERARSDRRMSVSSGDDGMGSLWLGGTAAQVEASWQCVDRLARSLDDPCDDRTLDQKRVDLAHQLLQGTLTLTDVGAVRGALGADGAGTDEDRLLASVAQVLVAKPDPEEAVGRRPLIQVVVPLSTLMGGAAPAELVGHGPIPADLARALAAGGVWQRLVTDPLSGTLLDVGRTRYRPPVAMADHVRTRDGTCRGPACSRRVRDLDHHRPWAAGDGPTSADNLFGLCRADHALKDAPGWQVLAGSDGSLTWIAPCGRRATTQPFDHLVLTDPLPHVADHEDEAVAPF
ncbi:HNH endonuclease signature motif containing protein [Pseudonocardia sp. ICBG1293]|uniref:HNH endonuclease signature motif containing protein n=1 Tax=Pseudonocardia sp. ICBG1293 TaxID=2844382 RepID=UPI001CCFBB36|nr:HNH endonuclease signature motif containing protein [Pseudonocardia sp. ICBG1293]